MQMLDVLAATLVVGAAAAFTFGAMALARASDIEATYYLVIGIVALRAGVQLVRPGAGA
jgi:purine nucleoside permease